MNASGASMILPLPSARLRLRLRRGWEGRGEGRFKGFYKSMSNVECFPNLNFIRSMRIAISGSTSTGKTTLIDALADQGVLERFGLKTIWTDERALLRAMGFMDMAAMNSDELTEFQKRFVQQKTDHEAGSDNFITEHSYVDCASYWVIRDQAADPRASREDELTARCRRLAGQYAVHILLPFGGIPFQADG